MAVFAARCPVPDRERDWIHRSMRWCRSEFGDALLSGPVILPDRTYFPPPFSGTDQDVRALAGKVAGFMGVRADIEMLITVDPASYLRGAQLAAGGTLRASGRAGWYRAEEDGRQVLAIDRSSVRDPIRLVAVIAHELGHARLLGEDRVPAGREDHEPLTDLATIYLGMGIFTANAALSVRKSSGPRCASWSVSRLGYLTEQMFGYGLACYATLRGTPEPPWARYLDTNPRAYMKRGISYLRHAAPAETLP